MGIPCHVDTSKNLLHIVCSITIDFKAFNFFNF